MKRKALFIGVNEYDDPQIRDLNYSTSDAHSLKAMFELLGFQATILENPAKSDVLRTLKRMTDDLKAGDFFLFYFAGHGWTSNGRHLLFCSDDIYEDVRSNYAGIPFDLLEQRTAAGGYNRAFVLDACRSDFLTGTRGSDTTTRDLCPISEMVKPSSPGRSSLAVLRSCSKYEHALEIESRGHGLFTLAMMDVLRHSQESGMELMFGETLCDAVTARMASIAQEEGITAEQTPEFDKTGVTQVLISGRKAAALPLNSSVSTSDASLVVCPVCGKYNQITDTFRCRVCGRDHLCLSHFSSEYNCCGECAEKQSAHKEERRHQEAAKQESHRQEPLPQEMYERGNDFYSGKNGVKQDYAEAVKWYRKAAEQGHAEAQYSLGICYRLGSGIAKDYKEAARWFRKAAEQGHAGAQYSLGRCYGLGSGIAKDYTEAARWLRMAAEQGNTMAQSGLGNCYENGLGVEQNYAVAVKWFRLAADQGNATAQCELGYCYDKGLGVSQDYVEAVKWYRKAAEQGLPKAQYNLALCYKTGQGLPLDYAESVKWLRLAAENGHVDAQVSLGVRYIKGQGVSQDFAAAAKWFFMAAERGEATAQFNLGKCLEEGEGVEKNIAEAVKWYRKAAEQGNEKAKKALERLGQ